MDVAVGPDPATPAPDVECVDVLTLCALTVVRIFVVSAELFVSAFATPVPPVSAAPSPRVIAPAPSHVDAWVRWADFFALC